MDPYDWTKKILERASVKWPPRFETLKKARRISELSDKRTKWEYQCNHCKEWFKSKSIQVDHIVPKGKFSRELFLGWLERLLCKSTNLQVLCIPCHKIKSANEHKTGAYK